MKLKNTLFQVLFSGILFLSTLPVFGSHIVGAELYYECVGTNRYNVTLKMYRDCANGIAPFDAEITLFVFRSNGTLFDTYDVPVPFQSPQIFPENWYACVGSPYYLCIEEGIYETQIILPPLVGGYDIAWARCCRNYTIDNLAQPQCEGVSFLAHVPDPGGAACNSMPVFDNSPSIFLCANQAYFFDYSATDPDGDSLVYEISNPYTGFNTAGLGAGNPQDPTCATNANPVVTAGNNPMGPPPYRNVTFAAGHSYLSPFGPGGYVNINPATGFLEAFPVNPGVYVMAVSVKEYRNGQLLSENKRDFQFNVIQCLPQGPAPVITHDLTGLNASGDTIFAPAGYPFCYDFTVSDALVPSAIQVTPISTTFGGNGGFPPPYAVLTVNGTNPPVDGTVCWRPSCDYIGQTIEVIISARDTSDCPNYNIIFDTIYVTVMPSPSAPPLVSQDISGTTHDGDTILINVEDDFCFDFMIIDTLGGGNLIGQSVLMDTSGTVLNQVHSVTTTVSGDTLFGEVCWESYCNYDMMYMFVTTGFDEYQCPPQLSNSDTVYLRVIRPYNPAPVVNTDISMNPVVNDTIQALVHEEFCFEFTVQDTSILGGDTIGFNYYIRDLDGNPIGGPNPTYSATASPGQINGEICWAPGCVHNDQTLMLIVRGVQFNGCDIENYDRDTIYVRVTEPYRPPPLISHDLGPNFPGNDIITLEDDESFCYDFVLEDTVSPSHLVLEANVYFANGQPYLGTGPVLTTTQSLDSLLEGNICWTIPCDLANQEMRIVLTGRDTLDCTTDNLVFDSVLVRHTENIPPVVEFCQVSVLPGDASIELRWIPDGTTADGTGYIIRRRELGTVAWTVLDTIGNFADSVYVDGQNVRPDEIRYCYQVTAIDRCGNESPDAMEACSILLTGEREDYISFLDWTDYIGWAFGPERYQVHRSGPSDGIPEQEINSFGPTVFAMTDDNVQSGLTCYRIRAVAAPGECGTESWSNEICLQFPATLFVPNAFTPNGDGLNDYFSSFGEFSESFDLQIFDRWGKLLFTSQDVNTGWDGTVNGKACPEGVYVYKIVVVSYDGEVLKRNGSVHLIR